MDFATPETIAARLEAAGYRVKRNSRGGYHTSTSICHGGDNPGALSFRLGRDGKLQVACFTPKDCAEGRLGRLLAAAGLTAKDLPPDNTKPGNRPGNDNDNRELAQRLWRRAERIPMDNQHPARKWLNNRRLWHPDCPAPDGLRYLPARGDHTGAGSVVALLAAPERWVSAWPNLPAAAAIQFIGVDTAGNPALDRPAENGGLTKRTHGPSAGAVFLVGNPNPPPAAAPARVAEGVADALAIAARFSGPAIAMMGTSAAAAGGLAEYLAGFRAVVIHADHDDAGEAAAQRLRHAIIRLGGKASAAFPPKGKDAADVAAEFPPTEMDVWTDHARWLREQFPEWPRYEVARQCLTED